MVHKCCVSSCGMSVRVVGAKGISYHSFPTKEPNREKWVQAILPHVDKPELFRIVQGYTRICSRHFKKNDYSIDSKKRARLSSSAIPSVFPGRDVRDPPLPKLETDKETSATLDLVDAGASLSLDDSSLTIFDNQILIDALRSVSEDLEFGTSIDQLARDLSDSLLDDALSSSLLNMDGFYASLEDQPEIKPVLNSDLLSEILESEHKTSPPPPVKLPDIPEVKKQETEKRTLSSTHPCTTETPKKRNKEESGSSDSNPEPDEPLPNRNRKKSARKKSVGCFCVERFQDSDKDMEYYTGFSTYKKFASFFRALDPFVENLKVTDMMHGVEILILDSKKTSPETGSDGNTPAKDDSSKRRLSQGRSMSRMDELFMTIVRLRRKIPEKVVGHMFCISQPSVSRIVRAWTMLLSKVLDLKQDENSLILGGGDSGDESVKIDIPNSFRQLFQSDLAQCIISTGNSTSNSRKTSSSITCPNTSRSKRPKKEKLVVVVTEQFQSSLSDTATTTGKKNCKLNLSNESLSTIHHHSKTKKSLKETIEPPPAVALASTSSTTIESSY